MNSLLTRAQGPAGLCHGARQGASTRFGVRFFVNPVLLTLEIARSLRIVIAGVEAAGKT